MKCLRNISTVASSEPLITNQELGRVWEVGFGKHKLKCLKSSMHFWSNLLSICSIVRSRDRERKSMRDIFTPKTIQCVASHWEDKITYCKLLWFPKETYLPCARKYLNVKKVVFVIFLHFSIQSHTHVFVFCFRITLFETIYLANLL